MNVVGLGDARASAVQRERPCTPFDRTVAYVAGGGMGSSGCAILTEDAHDRTVARNANGMNTDLTRDTSVAEDAHDVFMGNAGLVRETGETKDNHVRNTG